MNNRPPTAACRKMLARVSAYLDDELGTKECRLIDRHCTECETCAAIVEGLRRTVGLCRDAGERPLPSAVRQKARAQIDALLEPQARTRSPLRRSSRRRV